MATIKTLVCDRCKTQTKTLTKLGYDNRASLGEPIFRRIVELCAECNQQFLLFLEKKEKS